MKVKVRKVYYCDFCKKRLMRIDAIINHEKHCTANLSRICRMCDGIGSYTNYRETLRE